MSEKHFSNELSNCYEQTNVFQLMNTQESHRSPIAVGSSLVAPIINSSKKVITNSSPSRQPHIISPSKRAPEGYICVGRAKVFDNSPTRAKNESKQDYLCPDPLLPRTFDQEVKNHRKIHNPEGTRPYFNQLGQYEITPTEMLIQPQIFSPNNNRIIPEIDVREVLRPVGEIEGLPSYFNPRATANMPHREKVSNWITSVPIYYRFDQNTWFHNCFPGVAPDSSEFSSETDLYVCGSDDIIDLQARRVTYYATKLYLLDGEPIVRVMSSSEENNQDETAAYTNGDEEEEEEVCDEDGYEDYDKEQIHVSFFSEKKTNFDLSKQEEVIQEDKCFKAYYERYDDNDPFGYNESLLLNINYLMDSKEVVKEW